MFAEFKSGISKLAAGTKAASKKPDAVWKGAPKSFREDRPAPRERNGDQFSDLLTLTGRAPATGDRNELDQGPTPKKSVLPKSEKPKDESTPDWIRRMTLTDLNDPEVSNPEDQEKERQRITFEKARENRNNILGQPYKAEPGQDTDAPKMHEMSTKEYNGLTDRQRAAVDYNTILSDAVKRDLSRQDDYKGVDGNKRKAYDAEVESLFGEDRGSSIYAPETLAVLRQLKLDDKVSDMDDYLQLRATITDDDLGALETTANRGRAAILNPENMGRADYANMLADRAEVLQQSLAKGNDMLSSFSATALAERASDTSRLGGQVEMPKEMTGFSGTKTDEYFQQAFNALGQASDQDKDAILGSIQADMAAEPGLYDKFFQYADVRSRNALNYKTPLGDDKKAKYRSPDEFRQMLGLGE